MDPRAWRRFQKDRGAWLGAGLVGFVVLLSAFGWLVAPHDPTYQFRETLIEDDGSLVGPGEIDGHLLGGGIQQVVTNFPAYCMVDESASL